MVTQVLKKAVFPSVGVTGSFWLVPFLGIVLVVAALAPSMGVAQETTEGLRLRKRVGVGVSLAGPLSVMGIETEINLTEQISLGAGLGTGLDYSTFTLRGKYFLIGERFSPYLGAGIARWWTDGTRETVLSPSLLQNKLLSGHTSGQGFDVWMLYPALGLQYLHPMGIAIYAELQAFFKLPSLANGTYAGLGALFYF